jgi:hypothetical protein
MKTQYEEYELYKGDIWISKQDRSKEIQGTNIAMLQHNGKMKVLYYVIRNGDRWTFTHNEYFTLDEIVWKCLKAMGWHDEFCNKVLGN